MRIEAPIVLHRGQFAQNVQCIEWMELTHLQVRAHKFPKSILRYTMNERRGYLRVNNNHVFRLLLLSSTDGFYRAAPPKELFSDAPSVESICKNCTSGIIHLYSFVRERVEPDQSQQACVNLLEMLCCAVMRLIGMHLSHKMVLLL